MRYGALNPIPDGVQLAVTDDDKILFRSFAPMRSREASGLPGFVERELAAHGLELGDISFWSTGAGPGGFTALRMTAALVAAWAMGDPGIRFRCVPSAIALAGALPGKEGEELDCLFDGRNREILLYGLVFRNGQWESRRFSAVLDRERFALYYEKTKRRCLAEAGNHESISAVTGPVPLETAEPDCVNLIRTAAFPYDNAADNLIYIREAVEQKS